MRLTERSYPHPVVGNRDDVPGKGFQVAVEGTSDKENFYLDFQVRCSSEAILSLIRKKKAAYVAHVECSNTLYRQAFPFHQEQHRIMIPTTKLFDKFDVNVVACAMVNVPSYEVDGVHEDYEGVIFSLSEGDIIALADGVEFLVEAEDSLIRVGSMMLIEESKTEDDGILKVDWNGHKIVILLSKRDFRAYNKMKADEQMGSVLASAIVLPVLVEALNQVRESRSPFEDLRWYGILQRRLTALNISGKEFESLAVAQQLLEMPIKRALASAAKSAEGEE